MRLKTILLFLGVLVLISSLSACLESGPPDWALRLTPTASPRPTDGAPVQARLVVDPASVQPGRWQWHSFSSADETHPPVQMWLDVAAGGVVEGMLSIYPDYPDIPQAALTLIQQNGCNIDIESLAPAPGEPIDPNLISTMVARVAIDVSECTVKYYGPVTLNEPLRGEFVIAYDADMTAALIRAANEPLTPFEVGRNVFVRYCSGCHGSYGEGMPGIPTLASDVVRAYSDEHILTILRSGVPDTIMPAWGNVLSEAEIMGVLTLIRQIEALGS